MDRVVDAFLLHQSGRYAPQLLREVPRPALDISTAILMLVSEETPRCQMITGSYSLDNCVQPLESLWENTRLFWLVGGASKVHPPANPYQTRYAPQGREAQSTSPEGGGNPRYSVSQPVGSTSFSLTGMRASEMKPREARVCMRRWTRARPPLAGGMAFRGCGRMLAR